MKDTVKGKGTNICKGISYGYNKNIAMIGIWSTERFKSRIHVVQSWKKKKKTEAWRVTGMRIIVAHEISLCTSQGNKRLFKCYSID